MRYQLAPIHCRPWTLNGLSQRLIESHYENNYGGAVRRLNAIAEQLSTLDFAATPGYVLGSLKRDELTALNSTLLHELYFASLGGDGKMVDAMSEALTRDFGSVDRWRAEFAAMGRALAGGSGWVLLSYLPRDRRLVNQSSTEHAQAIPGAVPILALDMYEHAYHLDFGANAAAYVDTFLRNVDWKAVLERYRPALALEPPQPLQQPEFGDLPSIAVEEVREMLASGVPVQVIDARPRHYYTRSNEIAAGVPWRDPDKVHEWSRELSKGEPVIVYCAYGFHVGCRIAETLRGAGFDAKYMTGGHSAWKAVGGPLALHE
jgi:Fe-Mn family superoxide dismutase